MAQPNKRYRSDALAAVHETARGLHEAGLIDGQSMASFNMLCLMPQDEKGRCNDG